jgi:DinB superfamily
MEMKEFIQNGLGNVKRVFNRTLDGLTAAELKWQPRPDANSIGLILFHSIRAEDFLIHTMQSKPQLWESEKWYQKLHKVIDDAGAHYTAEQVAAFVVPDLKELLAYAEAVRKNTIEYLTQLKSEDFDKKVDLPPPPARMATQSGSPAPSRPAFNLTVGLMLLMLVTHLSQHAGEISYIRGLQRGIDK